MRTLALCVVLWLLAPAVSPAAAAPNELKVTLKGGRITVVAESVPVRRILEEWARLGQIQVTNLDKLTGTPVTLQLIDVSEKHALDVLLRSAAGFLAAPRVVDVPGASRFDRILILATSRPPAVASSGVTQSAPPPMPRGEVMADDASMQGGEVAMPQPGFMPPGPGFQGQIYPQATPLPFPNTGAAQPQQAQPPPVLMAPRPGMIQPVPDSPAQNQPSAVSPNPGMPVVPPAPVPGQAQPPKKPGGGA